MISRSASVVVVWTIVLSSCAEAPESKPKLTVAAAANLAEVFNEIGQSFKTKTGEEVIFSFGSTAQLAQQIENGAPFDVFAAADTEHVDALVARGKLVAASRAVYASGQLAMWAPRDDGTSLGSTKDLRNPAVRFVAVAQPELAPYGRASVEAIRNSGLWELVKPKIVYATNVNQAKQMAESGNADVAFTAYSLVLRAKGTVLKVDPKLYAPIDQALGVVAASPQTKRAQRFRQFLLGEDGRAILARNGYVLPKS